jgi:hypothetical protein
MSATRVPKDFKKEYHSRTITHNISHNVALPGEFQEMKKLSQNQ